MSKIKEDIVISLILLSIFPVFLLGANSEPMAIIDALPAPYIHESQKSEDANNMQPLQGYCSLLYNCNGENCLWYLVDCDCQNSFTPCSCGGRYCTCRVCPRFGADYKPCGGSKACNCGSYCNCGNVCNRYTCGQVTCKSGGCYGVNCVCAGTICIHRWGAPCGGGVRQCGYGQGCGCYTCNKLYCIASGYPCGGNC